MVDLLPVTRVLEHHVGHWVLIYRRHAIDGLGQVRAVPYTFVGNQCCGLGQLQWRHLHIALANAEDHGFAWEPRLATGRTLPGLGWHQAGRLFEHIQGHFLAQAELGQIVVQAVDPELMGQVVEVSVVGTHDGRVHVHPAVTAVVPVAVFVVKVWQLIVTRVEHSGLWGNDTAVETGNGHFRLDG